MEYSASVVCVFEFCDAAVSRVLVQMIESLLTLGSDEEVVQLVRQEWIRKLSQEFL